MFTIWRQTIILYKDNGPCILAQNISRVFITHAEILDQIERTIEIDCTKAIQITERDCIVTVNDHRAKIKLLVEGVEVQNQHLKCMDVEKEITNITIKDAPVELADITICTYMSQFG